MNFEEKQTSKAEFVPRESLLMAEVSTYIEVPAWIDIYFLLRNFFKKDQKKIQMNVHALQDNFFFKEFSKRRIKEMGVLPA